MKISSLPALLALASGVVTPSLASPRSDLDPVVAAALLAVVIEPSVPVALASIAALPSPAPLPAIGAPAPADVKVEVRREGASDLRISLRRKGHVIALRRGGERVVAAELASLRLPRGDTAPLIWETTATGTLATTRGLVVLAEPATEGSSLAGKMPSASLRLTAAPITLARDEGVRHACVASDDGAFGFTVLCRVDAMASAASLTGASPSEGIAVIAGDHAVVRVDLPAAQDGASAALVGYTDGLNGVVIRAEASRLPGEDHAVVTVVSASRPQPLTPPPSKLWRHSGPELFLEL